MYGAILFRVVAAAKDRPAGRIAAGRRSHRGGPDRGGAPLLHRGGRIVRTGERCYPGGRPDPCGPPRRGERCPLNPATLAQARADHAARLEGDLEALRRRLAAMPEVQAVILFGSYAGGRRDLFTDLDLLVVLESDLPFAERTARLYGLLDAGVDLDLLVYTPAEFAGHRERPFLRRILETGVVLHEKQRRG
ncbi:MAG: nucleotidyltransferase domain-containing protein [Deferrisomatales bacterium]